MNRIFLAPSKYVQGAGAIDSIGTYAEKLGQKALIVGGKTALSVSADAITKSLTEKKISCHQELFSGECSDKEIDRLLDISRATKIDFVIAAGGGKVLDTGKAVSHEMKIPIIVVPTIAATDAPCSGEAVIYSEDGVFEREIALSKNPDCVIVDTAIIARAPSVFLVSGMGDALATFWEADTSVKSNKPNVLTGEFPPTLSAIALARLCYDTLLEHGLLAKLAVEQKAVTPAVEAIVEANTLLSGLGFESGGLAAAHSIHNGLTVLKQSSKSYHGQKVAFGTITQLVLEGRPSRDLYEVLSFCFSVGLPVCMEDLDIISPTREDIEKVAIAATAKAETIHATWFPVTAGMVEDAIWTADAVGKAYKMKQTG
jgi:glycerol dehydrogenase